MTESSPDREPILSICIPTWNRAALLESTLEHLSFTRDLGFPVEIVISDNASDDRTPEVVRAAQEQLPWIRYSHQEKMVTAEANCFGSLAAREGSVLGVPRR